MPQSDHLDWHASRPSGRADREGENAANRSSGLLPAHAGLATPCNHPQQGDARPAHPPARSTRRRLLRWRRACESHRDSAPAPRLG